METAQLTKAEQSLIERVNQHGGIAKYKNWISYNVADRRYRFTYIKNLDNLMKKLKAHNALNMLKP